MTLPITLGCLFGEEYRTLQFPWCCRGVYFGKNIDPCSYHGAAGLFILGETGSQQLSWCCRGVSYVRNMELFTLITSLHFESSSVLLQSDSGSLLGPCISLESRIPSFPSFSSVILTTYKYMTPRWLTFKHSYQHIRGCSFITRYEGGVVGSKPPRCHIFIGC